MRLRCVFGHRWSFGIGPQGDHIIRSCRRCLKVAPILAEPAERLLQRTRDTEQIAHLFTRSGWPR